MKKEKQSVDETELFEYPIAYIALKSFAYVFVFGAVIMPIIPTFTTRVEITERLALESGMLLVVGGVIFALLDIWKAVKRSEMHLRKMAEMTEKAFANRQFEQTTHGD